MGFDLSKKRSAYGRYRSGSVELPPGSESYHFRILRNQPQSAVTTPRASRTEDELQRVRSAMPILKKLAKQRRRSVP
jgi:hypothetical protein